MNRSRTLVGMFVVLVVVPLGSRLLAQPPKTATEGYLQGSAELGNAQAAMLAAQAAVIKAVGEAATARVKASESLQNARAKATDNDVKAAGIYYEKRKLCEAYQGLTARQRPTKEDLARWSKAAQPGRPGCTQLDPARGTIRWPEILREEEFTEARAQLDYAFSQRNGQVMDAGSELLEQARLSASQMRKGLRRLMPELSPTEYIAARSFIDTLAREIQMPPGLTEKVAAK